MPAPMIATFVAGLDVGDRAPRAARTRAARPARRPRRAGRPGRCAAGDVCATRPSLQPPPESRQKPVCRPAETSPSVVWRQSATSPCAHSGHGGVRPRAAQPSAGWTTTRSPRARAGADLAHDLVAGDERRARQRREVQRGLAGEQREVGAADAGQARADRQPVRAGRARRADLLQRQRARAGQVRARRRRTWRCSACRSAPASAQIAARSVVHVSTGQRRRRASRESRKSGLIGCGWPTSSSIGRSPRLSP